MISFLLNLIGLVYLFSLVTAENVILNTKHGKLKGQIEQSREGHPYFAFYGIPYAEPPLGDLRYKNPVTPPKSWEGVRDGTTPSSPCLYVLKTGEIIGDEDCLYLNLYTPELSENASIPVMVFIFGSRFVTSNALPGSYGPQYFMDKNVILITFHYRLGALGFLSTGDNVLSGNYGLKDFAAVLNWVQENIKAFGGDKQRVTVFGCSSGGVTSALALVSPLTKGLFHRSISQSGYPFSVIQPKEARKRAWKFASYVGCADDSIVSSEDLVTCLKKLPARVIIKENYSLKNVGNMSYIPFEPVIEDETEHGAFLVDDPRKLLSRNSDIPWIIGLNSAEGGMMALEAYYNSVSGYAKELAAHYDAFFAFFINLSGLSEELVQSPRWPEISGTLRAYFFGDSDISINAQGFSKMITVLRYLPGVQKSVELYRGPLYVYVYDHENEGSLALAKCYGDPKEHMGVIHSSELISMFNMSSRGITVTKGIDLIVSEQVLTLWTNFAASGDPNGNGETLWNPVKSAKIEHLVIKNGVLEMQDELMKEEYKFLEKLSLMASARS